MSIEASRAYRIGGNVAFFTHLAVSALILGALFLSMAQSVHGPCTGCVLVVCAPLPAFGLGIPVAFTAGQRLAQAALPLARRYQPGAGPGLVGWVVGGLVGLVAGPLLVAVGLACFWLLFRGSS
jgi:hypothetical protein